MKKIKEPLAKAQIKVGKTTLNSNIADQTLISSGVEYNLADEGLIIETNKRKFKVQFDPLKFRPSDVPVLLSNVERIKRLGFRPKKELS